MTQKQKTHHLAVAAMLCAVAFVLQFIEFSIPLIPCWVPSRWDLCTAW